MKMALFAAAAILAATLPARAALDVAGLSSEIDPCVDFYRYANAKWLAATPMPEDRSTWGTFSILDARNELVLREVLAAAVKSPPPAGSGQRKVAEYYASGMDTAAIERSGIAPLEEHLHAIGQLKDASGLAALLPRLQRSGIPAGFGFFVRPDAKDSTRYLAQLAQGGLGLPDRDYYFNDDERTKSQREAYAAYVSRIFTLLGETRQQAAANAGRVLAVETELARASMTAVERRDVDRTYNKMSVEALGERAPGFAWRAYFDAVGARGLDTVNVAQPAFFTAFARIAAERTAPDWQAYLRFHLLNAAAPYLPRAYEEAHFAFHTGVMKGVKARPPRERHVLALIGGNYGTHPMAQALGMVFVDKAYPPEAKAKSLVLAENVKAALGDRLRGLEWMGEETRARALEKLGTMRVKIGYPDRWRDYSAAEVGVYPFVDNGMRAADFDARRQLAQLGTRVERTEWFASPHIVNAFYNGANNEIVFPAGILQPPFFDPTADDAVNYGGIGMVIGHEITHGFDDRGRRYDAAGNLRDWWTKEDAQRYLERAARIEKQYGAFVGVEGVNVNGKLTLGENISDVGGAKIAYLALQRALAAKHPGKIDGLSPEQRFFLGFAQIWRRVTSPEQELIFLRTDGHSPSRFRVKGVIENMREFAAAFSCDPAKTLRAASERASIW